MSDRVSPVQIDPELDPLDFDLEPDDLHPSVPLKKVPAGDLYEAARAGDVDRLKTLLEGGANVNLRDRWDSVALYYACLAGHFEAARLLLEAGAVCSERTFDGDRCHYAALNLRVRRLLKTYEARPPPLAPLNAALRDVFLACPGNRRGYLEQCDGDYARIVGQQTDTASSSTPFPPDITFYIDGHPIEAHRAILSARSPFFKQKFSTDWRNRTEVRFSSQKLSYRALHSLLHFFYSDRLEVAVDDMPDLVCTCKACKVEGLQRILEKEMVHQKYADYKSLTDVDNSQKRFILQGSALPKEDRLPYALQKILEASLEKCESGEDGSYCDFTDIHVKVGDRIFRCHQVVLAARSEYFRARLSRAMGFLEGSRGAKIDTIPFLEEHDLSTEAFKKMIEYMYTDGLKEVDPDQAEEMFDAASRYLLFPLKRAAADVLLPQLEMVSPAELCHWLILSDMYGVVKLREYCLDVMACNFENFADTPEFRAMLLTFPPPSGEDSLRTTRPSAPGTVGTANEGNLLDDLREKWLIVDGAELDKRDESAALFDRRLEMLMLIAEKEANDDKDDILV
ncbi:BTB/POZ domain-containing protein [Rhynchospora pubera]|uniref:BTB/POZ domain-containing protein n=1 Tax=Rhynchospora pubera TaxID=906938 RepID=A0AAV8AMC0_9POAL|nr:BTB/POZ domain-containing protein [Rhynchospora pubera]KAJ4753141.1 BTB/POZ domain-containing protein [Rhynchospora pubera]